MMLLAAACLLALGAVLLLRGNTPETQPAGHSRVLSDGGRAPLSPWLIAVSAAALALFVAGWYAGLGVQAGSAILLAAAAIAVTVVWRRAALRRELAAQLPAFINQVIRRLTVGANLSQAIEQAAAQSSKPLAPLLERTLKRTRLGEELADAFTAEAQRSGLAEMALLATVFRINHQYGGSIANALDSLVKLLQQRERARRELRAMTGETRFTAWVLGAVPALMAVYLLFISPQYLLRMWEDETGRQLLLTGAGMQLAGVLILWRMVRSV